ncbi:uncharacterized protein N0V89_003168 [Didymosphaeria variabile]|uniref:Helix-turn-helix domain-containing protein n=1 Tax=Didymosphaeria variabile TaxID=1932322 RepID=A0A9W9CF84_9PLEO|nr:uncharacterized protein N0V89_003168 [Didymosphaeria variabile]KAJ4358584.1 hypothetical protein N0V89_003168 [Didymosphaeria variabile]
MGSSASKGARAAGASTVRKYPSRPAPSTTRAPAPAPPTHSGHVGPTVHPPPQASETKTEAIDLDARDPQFASRLSSIGAVQPNPHFSHSSTSSFDPQRNTSSTQPSDSYGMMNELPRSAFPDPGNNPALRILAARQRIQEEAEEELENVGRQSFRGRKYVDASTITLALMRRQRGEPDSRIEEALGIKKGRLSALRQGMVTSV